MRKAAYLLCVVIAAALISPVNGHAEQAKDQQLLVDVLKTANQRLAQEISQARQENEKLKSDNIILKNEAAGLKRQKDEILGKVKILGSQNDKLEEEVTFLQERILELDTARKELETKYKAKFEEVEKIEKEVGSFEEFRFELNKYKDKSQRLRRNLESALDIKGRLAKELEDVKASLKELEDEKGRYAQEKAGLEKELADVNARIVESVEKQKKAAATAMPKKEKVQDEAAAVENELAAMSDKLEGLKGQKDIYTDEREELYSQLKGTLVRLAESNVELKYMKDEVADMHYNMGVIFQQSARHNEAIKEYEKVLEARPEDAEAHFNLALIYMKNKNDRKKAIYHYDSYLKVKPEAEDSIKVKKLIDDLMIQEKVWGEPTIKELNENMRRFQ